MQDESYAFLAIPYLIESEELSNLGGIAFDHAFNPQIDGDHANTRRRTPPRLAALFFLLPRQSDIGPPAYLTPLRA